MTNPTPYDFFVSYRHRELDRSWTRKTLVPALEAKGLRALIDYRDFRLGAPLVTEMARAVEESRFTVAVITDNYIKSNFTELENVMAKQVGLENSQVRLFPNEAACLRLVSAILMEISEDWQTGKKYLTVESAENPTPSQ